MGCQEKLPDRARMSQSTAVSSAASGLSTDQSPFHCLWCVSVTRPTCPQVTGDTNQVLRDASLCRRPPGFLGGETENKNLPHSSLPLGCHPDRGGHLGAPFLMADWIRSHSVSLKPPLKRSKYEVLLQSQHELHLSPELQSLPPTHIYSPSTAPAPTPKLVLYWEPK